MVRKALDEPLAAHGFAGGQGGADRAGVQVIFCCSEDDFRARHPGVLRVPEEPGHSGCVDVVVDLEPAPGARIAEVRLEAEPLPALLERRAGEDAAARARQLSDLPVEQGLVRLAALLRLALED